jgi:hypothetical protein
LKWKFQKGTSVASIGLILTKALIQFGSYKSFLRGNVTCSTSSSKKAKMEIPIFPKYNYEKINHKFFYDQILSSNSNMLDQTFGFV